MQTQHYNDRRTQMEMEMDAAQPCFYDFAGHELAKCVMKNVFIVE